MHSSRNQHSWLRWFAKWNFLCASGDTAEVLTKGSWHLGTGLNPDCRCHWCSRWFMLLHDARSSKQNSSSAHMLAGTNVATPQDPCRASPPPHRMSNNCSPGELEQPPYSDSCSHSPLPHLTVAKPYALHCAVHSFWVRVTSQLAGQLPSPLSQEGSGPPSQTGWGERVAWRGRQGSTAGEQQQQQDVVAMKVQGMGGYKYPWHRMLWFSCDAYAILLLWLPLLLH